MVDSSWRVVVAFDRKEDVRSLADYLRAMGEVTDSSGTVSLAPGTTDLFGYAPTVEAIEQVARIISAAIDSLGTKPSQVKVARWLADELRWSDEGAAPVPDGDGAVASATEFVVSWFNSPV